MITCAMKSKRGVRDTLIFRKSEFRSGILFAVSRRLHVSFLHVYMYYQSTFYMTHRPSNDATRRSIPTNKLLDHQYLLFRNSQPIVIPQNFVFDRPKKNNSFFGIG